jgi:hypothetical protein
MLDIDETWLDRSIDFTFIDPYSERLTALVHDSDLTQAKLITDPVQNISLDVFEALGQNDVLFIDSSHVCKLGSDVNYLLFDVLPTLKTGVWVHFHDVFWPFEYPLEWARQGVAWNESYFLRAFLQYNSQFEVTLFLSFLAGHYPVEYRRFMPGPEQTAWCESSYLPSSIWLRRL